MKEVIKFIWKTSKTPFRFCINCIYYIVGSIIDEYHKKCCKNYAKWRKQIEEEMKLEISQFYEELEKEEKEKIDSKGN